MKRGTRYLGSLMIGVATSGPATSELIAYYSFEPDLVMQGGNTLVPDDVNGQHPAQLIGGAEIKAPGEANNEGTGGVSGNYLSLNGSSGYLDLPVAPAMAAPAGGDTDGWSFAAWVRRLESEDNQQAIFAINPKDNLPNENRFQLYVNDTRGGEKVNGVWKAITTRDNHLTAWSRPSGGTTDWKQNYHPNATSTAAPALVAEEEVPSGNGIWHHVAVVVRPPTGGNPAQVHYYIDGSEVITSGTPHNVDFDDLQDDDRWSLGQDWDLINVNSTLITMDSDFFEGDLDEVRLYDHALTEDEILELAQAGYELEFTSPPRWVTYSIDEAKTLKVKLRIDHTNSATETIKYSALNPGDVQVHIHPYRTADGVLAGDTLSVNAVHMIDSETGEDYLEADLSGYFINTSRPYPVGNYRLKVDAAFPRENAVDVVLDAETFFTVLDDQRPTTPINDFDNPIDRDSDGADDRDELMIHGNLTVANGPITQTGPRITGASYQVGQTLPGADAVEASNSLNPIIFTFLTEGVTNANQITIRNALVSQDVAGDNITFTTNTNGGEIATVKIPQGDVDPAKHLVQRYVVTLDDGNTTNTYELFFQIDPVAPTVDTDPPAGRFPGPMSVELKPSETLKELRYRLNGSATWITASDPNDVDVNISSSALLEVEATDLAGNQGISVHLFISDSQPTATPTFTSFSNPAPSDAIEVNWSRNGVPETPGGGYHVYRVITESSVTLVNAENEAPDLHRLHVSTTGNGGPAYPPPGFLRVTDKLIPADPSGTGSYTWADYEMPSLSRAGLKAWYAVAYITPDGEEGPAFSPAPFLEAAFAPTTADRDEAVHATVLFLEGIQNADGSWGQGSEVDVFRATCEVLNAFAALPASAVNEQAVQRGLAFLKGRFLDHHEALARQIDTLQRYGFNPHDLHVRLAFRAAVLDEGTAEPLAGWGTHRAYLPDPWHTALAQIARRGASLPVPDIPDTNPESIDDLLDKPWMEALVNAASDTAISGETHYGWIPNNRDSIGVSATVFRALGRHRYTRVGLYGNPANPVNRVASWIVLEGNRDTVPDPDEMDFRDNLFDTASTLIHLRLDTNLTTIGTALEDARNYLMANRDAASASWGDGDAFITAHCLRALIAPQAFVVTDFGAVGSGTGQVERALRSRGFTPERIDADQLGADAALMERIETQAALLVIVKTDDMPADGLRFLRDTPLPVLNLAAPAADDFGLTTTTDPGTAGDYAVVLDVDHPLTRDITNGGVGTVLKFIFGAPPTMNAIPVPPGTPGVLAVHQGPYENNGEWVAVLMAYDRGEQMPGGIIAPGRRVMLPIPSHITTGPHGNGYDLLDAAVEWATYRRVSPR